MVRIFISEFLKEQIHGRLETLVFLLDLCRTQYFQNHIEILFLLGGIKPEQTNDCLQQNRCSIVPERVLGLCPLGCRTGKDIGNQTLDVIYIPNVVKGIEAKAFFHVQEIQHLNFIAFCQQDIANSTQDLTFGIKDDKTAVGIENIGDDIESGFTGTRSANDQNIQVSPVSPDNEADGNILGQDFILIGIFVLSGCIFSIDAAGQSPLGRTVFLSATIVSVIG